MKKVIILCGILYSLIGSGVSVAASRAHIYIDLASAPTLLQMADAVQQPTDEPKLFIWKRTPALPATDDVLLSLNAKMVDAAFLGERDYEEFTDLVDTALGEFVRTYPEYRFSVHVNASHISRTGHILEIIPKDSIEAIHFYEDSIGRAYWDSEMFWNTKDWADQVKSYYHVAFYNPTLLPFSKDQIIITNFWGLSQKLSKEQKDKVARLVGMDVEIFKHFPKEGSIAVFIDDPDLDSEIALTFLKNIEEINSDKKLRWIYKGHPRGGYKRTFSLLSQHFPDMIELPNKIPLETMIIYGIPIDYVAGYGSSIFFSFRTEQILGYIRRWRLEAYLESLLELGILKPIQIFNFWD